MHMHLSSMRVQPCMCGTLEAAEGMHVHAHASCTCMRVRAQLRAHEHRCRLHKKGIHTKVWPEFRLALKTPIIPSTSQPDREV